MVKATYRYRFYPTEDQKELLAKTFGCIRFVYNSILRWRTDAYYQSKEKIGYTQACAKLAEIKHDGNSPWLNDVSSVTLQQCLRHQQAAFKNFFEGRARYPKFRKKSSKQTARFVGGAFNYRNSNLYIAKIKKPLDVRWSRPLPNDPSSITISKDCAERYFVSCICEFDPTLLPVSKSTIGIDLGIKHLFVTDEGKKINNPRHTARYAAKLSKAQRIMDKKKLNSANWAKARLKVARVHAKIFNSRRDYLHKLSRRLVNENQVICVESLKVKNMIRNKTRSKHIADASWGEFVHQLEYKSAWAGRSFVKIDQFFPSTKRCSCCGYINDSLTLNDRKWTCPECSASHDRDINAAINIKEAGLALLACGESVIPVSI